MVVKLQAATKLCQTAADIDMNVNVDARFASNLSIQFLQLLGHDSQRNCS